MHQVAKPQPDSSSQISVLLSAALLTSKVSLHIKYGSFRLSDSFTLP